MLSLVGDTFIVSMSDMSVFLFAITVAVGVMMDVDDDDWDDDDGGEDITAGTFIVTVVVVDDVEFNAVRLFGSTNVTDVTISSSSVAFIAALVAVVSFAVTLGVVAFPFYTHGFSICISFKMFH